MTKEAYDQVMNAPHKAHFSHEVIAAAAVYEATKAWNEHKEKNGQDVSHAKAKEIMAAAGGALLTHLFETKGLDAIERHKVEAAVKKHSEQGGY